jgi:hypothetical protein
VDGSTSGGRQSTSPRSGSNGGGVVFIPVGFPGSSGGYGTPQTGAGFDTRADFDAWNQGKSREEIAQERAASRHIDRYRDSGLGGPKFYQYPNGITNWEDLTDKANRYRARNGGAPVGSSGQEGFRPSGGFGDAAKAAEKMASDLFPDLFPDKGRKSPSNPDPYAIPDPIAPFAPQPEPVGPYVPTAPPLWFPDKPYNPFAPQDPNKPGGGVVFPDAPDTPSTNPEDPGTWNLMITVMYSNGAQSPAFPFTVQGKRGDIYFKRP